MEVLRAAGQPPSLRLEHRPGRRTVAALVILVGGLLGAASAAQSGRRCAADCRRHMADCMQTRCAGLSAEVCGDRCRTVTGCAAGAAAIRTFATVVTECDTSEGRTSARQRIDVVRDDCPRTAILTLDSGGSVPDTGICQLYGETGYGPAAMIATPLQRLAISPDGGTIVFEIATAGRIVLPIWSLVAPEDGFYRIDADGSGMRRIGPPSRAASFKVFPTDTPPYFSVHTWPDLSFSPDGRFVVFTDRGRGPDGSDAVQVVVMNLDTGKRRQVSRFSASDQGSPDHRQDASGSFLGDDTVGISEVGPAGFRGFKVGKDGSRLRELPAEQENVIPGVGGNLVRTFFSGRPLITTPMQLPSMTADPVPGRVVELFTWIQSRVVQLTTLNRSDTGYSVRNRSNRVFFKGSADPLGTNPSHSCQLFTIGTLGGVPRQVTHFGSDAQAPSPSGCADDVLPLGCKIAIAQPLIFDPRSNTLLFDTSCDLFFGTTPATDRFLAVRGDGSGLREITSYPGLERAADGSIHVELPGPSASPGRLF